MRKITLMLLMCLISWCSYAQYPEGFEGTWTTQTGAGPGGPTGWAINNFAGPIQTWIQGNGGGTQPAYQGTHSAFMNNENVAPGTQTEDWLITPLTTVPANGQLRFWSRLLVPGDQDTDYFIRISTVAADADDQWDTDNYVATPLAQWDELTLNPSQLEWTEKIVPLSAYAGQQVYIAFVMKGDLGDRWAIDNVNVVSQCLDPTTLGANSISTNGANLTWTNPSGATQFEIEIIPQASSPTGTGVVYNGGSPYAIPASANLQPDTCYKYYIRAVCSPGNPSNWVGPFNFCTVGIGDSCAAPVVIPSLPYSITDNTSNNGDTVDGSPGATGCGTTSPYLNGNDVFYAYTPSVSGNISVNVTNNGTWAGVFVYAGCANVGVSCVGGASNAGAVPLSIPTLAVTAGTTYYIVISTWATPQTTPYTLTIQQVNCAPPVGQATTTTATNATLNWTNPSSATSWELVVQNPGAGIPSGAGTTVSTNANYVVSATTPGNVPFTSATAYEYYVRADCGNGTFSAWAGPYSFMTTQIPAAMPVVENWESGTTNGWSLSNGTQTNKWVYGTATSNSPTHSIYVSNDNGVTNAYNNASASVVHAYRDITIPAGADQAVLQFDWKNVGEVGWDFIRVWMVPTSFMPTTGTMIAAGTDRVQVGGNFVGNATWTTSNNILSVAAYAGQTRRLVFEWRNDGIIGTNPPGAVDNINFAVITCPQPTNLTLGATTESQATFNWTAPTTPPASYDYYFSTTSTAPTVSTTPTGTTTTTTNTQSGLLPSTAYYFWVRSHCSDTDQSFWVGPVSFTTPQVPAALPLSENWENGSTNGWTLSNGTQTNKWFYGTAVSNSPTHSLYVTNDNGVTNAYNNAANSVVHAYRDVTIPAGTSDINFSFDWKNVGETGWDYIRAWIVPATWTPTPGTQITAAPDRIQLGGNFVGQSTWQTYNQVYNAAAFAGSIRRIVFEWRNDGFGGVNPPGAVDNINVSIISCPQPSNLTLGATTATSAPLSWTAPLTPPASYDYYVSTSNTAPTGATVPTGNVTTTNVTINDLLPSTTYYFWVRSHCSDADTSFWTGPVSYSTPQIPATLPISENWENGGTNGWTLSNGTQPNKWFYGTATYNTPTHSIYVSNDNGVTNAYNNAAASVVHAYRDFTIPAGTTDVNLSFDWKNVGEVGWDFVRVWMVPVSWTPTTGTMITASADRIQVGGNFVGNSAWTNYTAVINMGAFAGTNRRMVFEWRNDGIIGTNPPGAVDNINLSIITCPQPTALTVTDETTTTMSLSWTGTPYAGVVYQVYYTPAGSPPPGANPTTNVETTTATSIVLEDLLASTVYDVYVRALCDTEDGNSFWTGPVQHETDPLCPEPIDLEISCASSTGVSLAWTADGSETSWEVVVQPASAPIPTSGEVVTEPVYLAEGLTPGVAYTAYVRAICPDVDGFSSWAEIDFTANVGPGDAEPFCAGSVSVPNSTGVTGYGSIGCLGSTPNPIWYYLTVDDEDPTTGGTTMNFTLTQVSNTGNPIDVDFAAFGPFTSALDACNQIELVPGANPLIVACSYSASATEIFTIPNVQDGQVYALLLTNFNGSAGNITLTQTNATVPGAPVTSCEPIVELGPDQQLCATDSTTVTAEVADPEAPDTYTYVWYMDGDVFTPTIVETTADSQTVEIDEPGEHIISVIVTTPDSTPDDDPITDVVTITLSPVFTVPVYDEVVLCGATGTAALDFGTLDLLGDLDAADYEVTGVYPTAADAQSGTNAISSPFTTGTTTVYVAIGDIAVPDCFQVAPLSIVVNTTPDAAISYADAPYCSDETTGAVTQTGDAGGVYTSTTGLVIDAATGAIDIAGSTPGTYTITYTIAAADSCPEFSTTATITIEEAPEATIAYTASPYCSDGGTATVTQTGTTGGTYSSTPGLVIDATTGEIDLDASTAGSYVVTYTIADTATCTGIAVTAEVVITELPTAAITYAGSPYCSDAGVATVTFTGNAGGAAGTYTATDGLVIDAATGEINLAANAAGTYTVTYTVAAAAGCDVVTATADVTITELPEAGFSYAYTLVCQNAGIQQITLNQGATAGTFATDIASAAGLDLNAATGAINPANSDPGTYVVTNTIAAANGCGDVTATFTIVITPAPVPTFSYAAVAYCQDETTNPVPVLDGASGTFSAPAGLVINAATGEVNLAQSTPGTYVVTNTIVGSDSCPTVFATAEITITSLPVLGTAQGCEDNLYMISVNFDNDAVYSEDTVTIEWTAPDGSYLADTAAVNITGLAAGTYSVEVTPNDGAVCPAVAQVVVERTTCFTPKGVSPNDDGKNDTWDLTGFNVRKVSIFNRYGKEVYHFTGNYTDQFAGYASNGEKLPSGTYFYMFERLDGTTETGWVYVNFEEN